MSELAELVAPYYQILSVAAGGKALAGVGRILPTFQPVHIDADIHIWKIKAQSEPGVFRLSLKDSYPYTGVENDRIVIATVEESEDKEWRINYWKEFGAFSIELNTGIYPTPAWTLSSDKPDAQIVLQLLVTIPQKTQLFKIEAALD